MQAHRFCHLWHKRLRKPVGTDNLVPQIAVVIPLILRGICHQKVADIVQ